MRTNPSCHIKCNIEELRHSAPRAHFNVSRRKADDCATAMSKRWKSEEQQNVRFVTFPCMTSTPLGLPVVPEGNVSLSSTHRFTTTYQRYK